MQPAASSTDGALRGLDRLLDGDDAAVFDEDVTAALAGLVDEGPAADDDLACVSGCVVGRHQISPDPSRWKRTAMRTRTPFLTWRVTKGRRQIGDVGGDLDSPDHRPGMHDQGVFLAGPPPGLS